jgi:hypothetical protein
VTRYGSTPGGGRQPARTATARDQWDWSTIAATSELPAVASPSPVGRGLAGRRAEPPGDAERPADDGHLTREPAPVVLRLAVWSLAFVFVLAAAGDVVLHVRPGWLRPFRHVESSSPSGRARPRPGGTASLLLVSSDATGATFEVPAQRYRLVVTTAARCWTTVKSPPDATGFVFARTITPATSPASVEVSGAASVELAARAVSLAVRAGDRTVGVIRSPRVAYRYTFEPTTP